MPYLWANMIGTRAVRNTANYLIRNVYTALGKAEAERTAKENSVLLKVSMCLREANIRKETAYKKKLAAGKTAKLSLFRIPDEKNRTLGYEQIDAILKYSKDPAYYSCTSQVNQQAIRKTCNSWKGFFSSLKKWKKDPSGYSGRPRIPGYIRENAVTAHFTNQVCTLNESSKGLYLSFCKTDKILHLGLLPISGEYVKTEFVPAADGCKALITFDDGMEYPEIPETPSRIMAIDPGVNNFAACVTNTGMTPFLLDGRYLKSLNHLYNRKLAKYRSCLYTGHDMKGYKGPVTSRRIARLTEHREKVMRDWFYKAAHSICRRAQEEEIELILVGHNKGQKQNSNMGSVSNQNFVQIPFARFNRILQHTAAKYGIAVAEREESYTSKADFLAGDSIPVYGQKDDAEYVFSGRRIRRGLYKNAEGIILNADVNGAANILRKSYPDAFAGIEPDVFCKVEKIVVNMKSKPIKGSSGHCVCPCPAA